MLFTSPAIAFFLEALRRDGCDPEPLLREFALDPVAPAISMQRSTEFFDACATLAGEPLLGLRVARELPRGSYGVLDFVWASASTLKESYEVMRELAALVSETFRPVFVPHGKTRGRLVFSELPLTLPMGRQGHEFMVARTLFMMRKLTAGAVHIHGVGFAHVSAGLDEEVAAAMGTDVFFGEADNWIELDVADLTLPIVSADPALFHALRTHLGRDHRALSKPSTFLEQVCRAILERLPQGAPVADVARAMRLSPRTLQRRLESELTSYRLMLDAVRHREALRLTAGDRVPLAEVAWQLGFSQYTAFARAFRRWTGRSPRVAQRALSCGAPGAWVPGAAGVDSAHA